MKLNFTLLLIAMLCFFSTTLLAKSISGRVEASKRVKKIIVYLRNSEKSINRTKTHHVSQKNAIFRPAISIITRGDKIEWINDEPKEIDHNIFSLNALTRFDLGLGEKDSRLSQEFNKTGILNYYCSVHKTMEGQVIVLPNAYYQYLERPGNFTISLDNLPKGEWVLDAIVFHRRYKAIPIKLSSEMGSLNNLSLKIIKR